jgi:hypothetical protein
MRIYSPLTVEQDDTHSYHLPQDSYISTLQDIPNWNDILSIEVAGCPLQDACVAITQENITRHCNHIGAFAIAIEQQIPVNDMLCKCEGKTNRQVLSVRAHTCPAGEMVCASKNYTCIHFKGLDPLDSDKPHYSVTCDFGWKPRISG